jgi:RNA polymerase sigma factor (sigma-70 family)
MCTEHAHAHGLQALSAAYLAMADRLTQQAAEALGWPETEWPAAPGPRELLKMASDCRRLAKAAQTAWQHDVELADRRPDREVLTDPDQVRRRGVVEEGLLELWPGRPSRSRISQDDWTKLRAVLGKLPESERKAFYLVHGRGLTHRQAAREMKTTRGSVYNLLTRAEEKIAAWRGGDPAQAKLDFGGEAAD